MVYVKDDGVYDEPLEKIWKYIQAPEDHVHETILSQKILEQTGNTMKLRVETFNARGGKEEQIWRETGPPPFGHELEVLEGSTKGTKQAHMYIPMGEKTKVIVVGDFKMPGADDETIRKGTLDYLAKVFTEDSAQLRKFKEAPSPGFVWLRVRSRRPHSCAWFHPRTRGRGAGETRLADSNDIR